MSDIETDAAKFKAWAAESGILSYKPPEDEADPEAEPLQDITDANDAAAATHILSNKKINLVAVDPINHKILICTHRKLTSAEIDALPKKSESGFDFEYLKAHQPQVRVPAQASNAPGAHWTYNQRYACGSSISVGNNVAAGTLGCLVRDDKGKLYGLTNNHVTGGCGYSSTNMPIVAPGLLDVKPLSHDPFTLGHHHSVSPWISGSPENVNAANNLDAALFVVKDEAGVSSMQQNFFDTPDTVVTPAPGMAVEKVGRTTGRTRGHIIGKSVGFEPVAIQVPEFKGVIYFNDIFIVRGVNAPFAEAGDSGSLVCFRDGASSASVGLVFAVSADKTLTFIVPIDKVLLQFSVTIVSGHNLT